MWRIYILLGTVTLIAGLTPIAAQMATRELPPLSIPLVRFGTAGALLAMTARLLRLGRPIRRSLWPMLVGLGVLCVPINQVGFLVGIQKSSATHAGIAYALVPLLVYWISLALGRTQWTNRLGLASVLACAGATMIVLATVEPTSETASTTRGVIVGDVLLLSAAISWSLFVVLSQPIVKEVGAVLTLSIVFLLGSASQVPLVAADGIWFELAAFQLANVTWQGWVGLAFITLITAYGNYLLWYIVTAKFDITRSAVVTNAHFCVTVLVEAMFFGQRLSVQVLVGAVVLLGGIVLATRSSAPDPQKQQGSQ